jgi:adenylate cyclase
VRALAPDFGIETFLATLHYARESDVEHVREGLIKAGAEDGAPAESGVAAQ